MSRLAPPALLLLCGLACGCGRGGPIGQGEAKAPAARAALAAAGQGAAGPAALFGIVLGAPVASLPGARPFKPGWYAVPPPHPEPGLERAAVEAFADTGICVIQGVGPVIAHDPEGVRTRAAIDALAWRMSELYGEPAKVDDCTSLVCKPEFWAIDLETGERRYGYRWPRRDSRPHGIWEISLVAQARNASDLVYLVEVDSQDLNGCRDAETQAASGDP